jgi:CHAT domain/WD domain, G-beta repeat
VSPDGSFAVTGSADGTVRVWDLKTHRLSMTYRGHQGAVIAVTVAPDGRRIVSGSADRTVRVWSVDEPRTEPLVLTGHGGDVNAVAVRSDGVVRSGSDDGTIRSWERERRTGPALDTRHPVLAFHHWDRAERTLALAECKVTFWRRESRFEALKKRATPAAYALAPPRHFADEWQYTPQSDLRTFAVAPDGHHAALGAFDGTITWFDLETRATVFVLEGHHAPVYGLCVTPDGKRLVSVSGDRTLRVWDLTSGTCTKTLRVDAELVGLAVTPDGTRAVSGSNGLRSFVWDLEHTKLHIELVRGNVVQSERADAIVIPTFRDVPITGVGAALDAALGGAVSVARRDGTPLTELTSSQVDAKWLLLADLGDFATRERTKLLDAIEGRASDVARLSLRHDFRRIALVTFAATILPDVGDIAARMIKGLRPLAGDTAVQWFETDQSRFNELRAFLEKQDDVSLVVREIPEAVQQLPASSRGDAVLFVRFADGILRSTLLLPSGPAVSREYTSRLSNDELKALSRGDNPVAPPVAELDKIGLRLAELLLGPDAKVDVSPETRLVVDHDIESAALPFETLRINGRALGVDGGVVRRLTMDDFTPRPPAQRSPTTGRMKLLLIVNPTGDLKNTEAEAEVITNALVDGEIDITRLRGTDATKEAVLKALRDPSYDVLHYAGHAYFDGLDGSGSGLICAKGEPLELHDLQAQEIGPRILFFNTDQSARVRSRPAHAASMTLAEYALRGGVEAYLGTSWPVNDAAAVDFAVSVYRSLAEGKHLDEAVRRARAFLRESGKPDWASYTLYGNGRFQLKTS